MPERGPVGQPAASTGDPVLDLLLDAAQLSELVGRPVRATRVRPKPGVSHVVGLVGRPDERVVGWAWALVGEARAKAEKALDRARRHGRAHLIRRAELPELETSVLWGPVAADPRLVGGLAGLDLIGIDVEGLDLQGITTEGGDPGAGKPEGGKPEAGHLEPGDPERGELLRYNPLRRMVLRRGDHVVRVTADAHRSWLVRLTRALGRLGVPVLRDVPAASVGLPGDRRVSVWEWVEGQDLASGGSPDQLAEAGRVLAGLHAVRPELVDGRVALPRRGWAETRRAASASVEQLARLTGGGARAREALALLPEHVDEGPDVLLHGDFSLDQCLAGPEGVVLGDLDRVCLGPAEVDLAGAVASGLVGAEASGLTSAEASGLTSAGTMRGVRAWDGDADVRTMLEGYAAARPDHSAAASAPWVAAHLLARVVEPWRRQTPDWPEQVDRIAQLALDRLRAQEPWAVPGVVTGASGEDITVLRAWPDQVVDGVARVAVEGPDGRGRLRAGTVDRAGRTRLLPPASDPRLPDLAGLALEGKLLVHRAGRRAVVQLPDRYVKVIRPRRAAGLAEALRRGELLAGAARLAAPRVLAVEGGGVHVSVLPGRAVHAMSDDPAWQRVWSCWARRWAAFQTLPTASLPPLPEHGPSQEADVLRTWADRAAAAGVLVGTPWPDRLLQTARDLDIAPPVRLVPTHRDLHDKQLLWDGRRIGVLDLDTVCLAEPVLDLANLAVHARLRRAQGRWSGPATQVVLDAVADVLSRHGTGMVAELDAAGLGETGPGESWPGESPGPDASAGPGDLALAERATVARLAAVYAFRPAWRDVVLRWAETEWSQTT